MQALIDSKNLVGLSKQINENETVGQSAEPVPATPTQMITRIENLPSLLQLYVQSMSDTTGKKILYLSFDRKYTEITSLFGYDNCKALIYTGGYYNTSTRPMGGAARVTAYISSQCNMSAANASSRSPWSSFAEGQLTDIYTDAASAPAGWGQYWNKKGSNEITTHYGVSLDEYLDIID